MPPKSQGNVLEPAGFDGTSYYFDVKEANIESYYSGGGYSSDYVFQKIRVHLKEDGIEVTLYSNTSNAGEHVFEDVKKLFGICVLGIKSLIYLNDFLSPIEGI